MLVRDFVAPLLAPVRDALPCSVRPLLRYIDSATLAPEAASRFLQHCIDVLSGIDLSRDSLKAVGKCDPEEAYRSDSDKR